MAIRLYGQKLPPLPVKTKIAQSFHSDEDKSFFIEDSEDEPLLSKNVGEKKAADVVRTLKDACTTSSNFHKHNTNERSKVHYSSTEDSRMSPCSSANGVTSAPHNDQSIQAASSNRCTISALVENGDHTHSGSESSREGPHLSDLFLKRDTDPPVLEVDRFDLYITNTLHGPESRLGRMTRSVSSTESSKHPHDVTDSRACLELRQLHRLKPQHKWPGISRSQSQPLATSEEEYSMYWRGDVTVIEMPGAELPDLKSEQTLDDEISASAISKSILAGNNQLLLECIKQGENPHLTCKKTGRSYFHVIASLASADHEVRWVPMVYQLSNVGVDVQTRDKEGQTAVRIAIKRRLVQILGALLKCGAELDAADEYHADQVTGVVKSEMTEVIRRLTPSYWSAVHDTTHFKVNRLIKAWSRVNISRKGQTLIEYAKQNAKDPTVVKLLIQNEASVELAHAVMAGDADRARVILCDSAADLATSDSSVKSSYFEDYAPMTLLGAAIKYEHVHILKLLKEASKSKQPMVTKIDFSAESGRARAGDISGSSPCHQVKSQASSTSSLINNAVYSGRTSAIREPDSVTSVMCSIL